MRWCRCDCGFGGGSKWKHQPIRNHRSQEVIQGNKRKAAAECREVPPRGRVRSGSAAYSHPLGRIAPRGTVLTVVLLPLPFRRGEGRGEGSVQSHGGSSKMHPMIEKQRQSVGQS